MAETQVLGLCFWAAFCTFQQIVQPFNAFFSSYHPQTVQMSFPVVSAGPTVADCVFCIPFIVSPNAKACLEALDSTLRVTDSAEGLHFQTVFTSYANLG